MWPVGWEALGQGGDDVVRVEPLSGGAGVNEVALPHNAAGLDDDAYDFAAQAQAAWAAAVCWDPSGTDNSRSSGSPKFERSEPYQHRRPRCRAVGRELPQGQTDRAPGQP